MLRQRQLLFSILSIVFFSCNSANKQSSKITDALSIKSDTLSKLDKEITSIVDKTVQTDKKGKTPKLKKAFRKKTFKTIHLVHSSLADDFKLIEKDFQNFIVNPNSDTTLICKEGTEIKIKHNSFIFTSSKSEAQNEIIFQVKEFYKISDIVTAGLSTTSNGNIIETGGMLFVQAFSEGQICELKNNSPVEISFPFAERKDNMILFSGNWTNQNLNWQPIERQTRNKVIAVDKITKIRDESIALTDTLFKKDFETTISDTNLNKVKTADIRQYVFSTSKLGWINCDRFYNNSKPKTDFYVDCGNYTELDIKLVFHSFRAILDNSLSKTTNKFQNLPNDERITIVVVKKIDNETFISLTQSNTNLKSINNLAFEKVTMDKLKLKLQQLNN